jgi:hypothetical protein
MTAHSHCSWETSKQAQLHFRSKAPEPDRAQRLIMKPRFVGRVTSLTFSPFLRNEALYSACVSSDRTHATEVFALETSIELERDLPPGNQLLRMRPRVGLWLTSPLDELGRIARGVETTRLLVLLSRLLGDWTEDARRPRSGIGDVVRVLSAWIESPFEPLDVCWREPLLGRAAGFSFRNFLVPLLETSEGGLGIGGGGILGS